MNVLLENFLDHVTAHEIFDHLRTELIRGGHQAALGSSAYMSEAALAAYDVLVSNKTVTPAIRSVLRSYGGKRWTRPETLAFLRKYGVETMTWSLARDRREVLDLFERWDVERMLLKRSHTMKAMGVVTFAPHSVNRLEWNPEEDVFCKEVNPDDGDLYKAELFNGELIIAWSSHQRPIRAYFEGDYEEGSRKSPPNRRLIDLPPELLRPLSAMSRAATGEGIGYVTVDMMRAPDGRLQAIEMNLDQAATWWTGQFPFVKERYAAALQNLLATLQR